MLLLFNLYEQLMGAGASGVNGLAVQLSVMTESSNEFALESATIPVHPWVVTSVMEKTFRQLFVLTILLAVKQMTMIHTSLVLQRKQKKKKVYFMLIYKSKFICLCKQNLMLMELI